jgi:hypothetical protein
VAGIVTRQGNAALSGVFVGARGVEFGSGISGRLGHGDAPCLHGTLRRGSGEEKSNDFIGGIPLGNVQLFKWFGAAV